MRQAVHGGAVRTLHPLGKPADLHGHRLGGTDQVRGKRDAGRPDRPDEPVRRTLRANRSRHRARPTAAWAPTPRIGSAFLYAGTGYGGSCLPKDVRAIIRSAKAQGVDLGILRVRGRRERPPDDRPRPENPEAVRRRPLRACASRSGGWRSSRARMTCARRPRARSPRRCANGEQSVVAHDPAAMEQSREFYLGDAVEYAADEYEALDGADALVVVTEWLQYRRPDWARCPGAADGPPHRVRRAQPVRARPHGVRAGSNTTRSAAGRSVRRRSREAGRHRRRRLPRFAPHRPPPRGGALRSSASTA